MANETSRGLAAAYRKNQSETVTLPSGSVALLRRPPLQIWASTGKFPQRLLAVAMTEYAKNSDLPAAEVETAKVLSTINTEDKFAMLKFMVDVVLYAFVEPRLVEGGTGDNELDPGELAPGDFNFVFKWATRGNQAQVAGKNGLTVGAVETFRESGRDKATADAGRDVPAIPDATPV